MSEPIVSPIGRLLYVRSLWTARRFQNNPQNPAKYSCTLIINKNDPALQGFLAPYNAEAATLDGYVPNPQGLPTLPYGKKSCILDGAVRYPTDPFYADKYILSTSCSEDNGQPNILLGPGQPVMDKGEIYDGVDAQVFVRFYAYAGGTGGINAELLGVMKTGDNDKLGDSTPDASAAFAAAGAIGSGPTVAPVQPAPAGFAVPAQPAYAPIQPAYAPIQPAYAPIQQPAPAGFAAPAQPAYAPIQQPAPVAQPAPGVPVQPAVVPGQPAVAPGQPPAQPWQ